MRSTSWRSQPRAWRATQSRIEVRSSRYWTSRRSRLRSVSAVMGLLKSDVRLYNCTAVGECENGCNRTSEVNVAAAPRRVGAETSKTRDALLHCVEQMMLEDGYASVSYRALATKAGVTPSLVQYYFPSLDDIFLAAIQRYSERNLTILAKALEDRPDDPLHALWDFSWDEATGALMTEFMALGNHRKSIRSAIADVTNQVRQIEVKALAAKFGKGARLDGDLS